jgi:tRNA (mo5U34)-methyltransferase
MRCSSHLARPGARRKRGMPIAISDATGAHRRSDPVVSEKVATVGVFLLLAETMQSASRPPLSESEIRDVLESIEVWHHSLDLGHGIVSPGNKSPELLKAELAGLRLPDLRGKSVLDIGAWDGFYSFEAERRGAARVVALDHFVWSIDWEGMKHGIARLVAEGKPKPPFEEVPEGWDPVGLPGKRGFDLAHRVRESRVETVVGDFMDMDLTPLGTFDVTLYLGVLYHMKHPLLALERLSRVTGEVAVIETHAIHIGGHDRTALCEFYEDRELNNDPTNWWAPTRQALAKMCRAAGFAHVDLLTPVPVVADGVLHHYRLHAHAWKTLEARAPYAAGYVDPPDPLRAISTPSFRPAPPTVKIDMPWSQLAGAVEDLKKKHPRGAGRQ